MSFLRLAGVYLLTLACFLVIDLVWLGWVARGLYARQLGALMRPDVRWGAAFLFYGIYVAGVLVLAVLPGLERESAVRAATLGAVVGLVSYAAWDLTNLAVLKDFPTGIVALDMAWGTFLTAVVGLAGYGFARALLP